MTPFVSFLVVVEVGFEIVYCCRIHNFVWQGVRLLKKKCRLLQHLTICLLYCALFLPLSSTMIGLLCHSTLSKPWRILKNCIKSPLIRVVRPSFRTISNLQTPVSLMNLSPNANSFIQSCLTKNYRARPTAFTLATHTFLGSNLSSQSYHNLHPAAPHKVSSQNYNQELNQVAADLINNAVNVVNNNNNNNNNSNSNSSHSHNSSNGNSLLGAAPVQVPPIVPNPYHNDYRSMGFGGMGLGYQKSFRTEFQKEFNVQQHFNPNSFNFNSFSDDFKIF